MATKAGKGSKHTAAAKKSASTASKKVSGSKKASTSKKSPARHPMGEAKAVKKPAKK